MTADELLETLKSQLAKQEAESERIRQAIRALEPVEPVAVKRGPGRPRKLAVAS